MAKPTEGLEREIAMSVDLRPAYRIIRLMGTVQRIALHLPARVANPILIAARRLVNRFSPAYFPEITEWEVRDIEGE